MKRENALAFCKYYKGEEACPYNKGNKAHFWDYERVWVAMTIGENSMLDDMVEDYINYGLSQFYANDDTPLSLKSVIFNRYIHWFGGYGAKEDIKGFMDFYINKYKMGSK